MKFEQRGDLVLVQGDLVRETNPSGFTLPPGSYRFDMSQVRIVSSAGARDWLRLIERLDITPVYVNCSEQLVQQFNMVREFFANGARVESVLVPLSCAKCGREGTATLVAGRHFGGGLAQPVVPQQRCAGCGELLQPEVDLETYLYFANCLPKAPS